MNKKLKAERIAFYAYTAAVSFSPLGPVVHYMGWGITLVTLLYLRFAFAVPILPIMEKEGRKSFLFFSLTFIWIALAGLLTLGTFHEYGRNVTVILEMLFGIALAVRVFNTEEKRQRFIGIFVMASIFIFAGNLLRNAGIITYFPNHSLINGNSLGALGVFCVAPFAVYAFWGKTDSYLKQIMILFPLALVLFFSFSSGAWLAAACSGLVILWYGIKQRKLCCKFFIVLCALMCILGWGADYYSKGLLSKRLLVELDQMSNVHDVRKLTNDRDEIWKASLYMLSQRPLTGWAGVEYEKVYKKLFNTKAEEVGLKYKPNADHPHSTFLYLLYLGGVPALLFFFLALVFMLKKSLKQIRNEKKVKYAWCVMSIALIAAVLVNGLTGDVFQGRRDIAVMVWGLWGMTIAFAAGESAGKNFSQSKNGLHTQNED